MGGEGRDGMKLAILTDIHANREAFQAVLEDACAAALGGLCAGCTA